MSQSLVNNLIHLIFSTKHRAPLLSPSIRPEMNYWQSGYGAFSVSQSNVDDVRKCIAEQEIHHRKMSFQEEFRRFLERHEIAFDERYVWD